MNTGDLFISLAKSAGIDVEKNEDFLKVMANKELATADFPDALAGEIQSKLLTLEAAKNNSDLKSHFKAQALNAVDGKLEEFAAKYGLGDDFINKLKEKQGTYENMGLTFEKLNEVHVAKLEEAMTKTDDPKLKEKLQENIETINGLQGDLSKFKETHAPITEMNEMRDGYEEMILSMGIKSFLSNYDYANKDIDKSVNIITAQTLVDQALTSKGVKFVTKDGNINLQTNDGMDFFNTENQKIDTQSFLDGVMAEHKLLKTAEPPATPPGTPTPTPPVVANGANGNNSAYLSALATSTESNITQLTKEI